MHVDLEAEACESRKRSVGVRGFGEGEQEALDGEDGSITCERF